MTRLRQNLLREPRLFAGRQERREMQVSVAVELYPGFRRFTDPFRQFAQMRGIFLNHRETGHRLGHVDHQQTGDIFAAYEDRKGNALLGIVVGRRLECKAVVEHRLEQHCKRITVLTSRRFSRFRDLLRKSSRISRSTGVENA